MQFTIPRETILPLLGAVSRTARPNGQIQQLGFLLAVRQTPLDTLTLPASVQTGDLQLLVPASVAAELASSLPEAKTGQEVPVTLSVTPDLHHLVCQAPGWEFASRLADGAYVD